MTAPWLSTLSSLGVMMCVSVLQLKPCPMVSAIRPLEQDSVEVIEDHFVHEKHKNKAAASSHAVLSLAQRSQVKMLTSHSKTDYLESELATMCDGLPQLLQTCADASKAAPLSSDSQCQHFAMILQSCKQECQSVAEGLDHLTFLEIIGPAKFFFRWVDKPCPQYQVRLIKQLRKTLKELVDDVNHAGASGTLSITCRTLDAVWAFSGLLHDKGMSELMNQLKARVSLPTNGDLWEIAACNGEGDPTVEVKVGRNSITESVDDGFDKFFKCTDYNTMGDKLPRVLRLGESMTEKCQDVSDFSRSSANYPGRALYPGLVKIECLVHSNGNGNRGDESRGMKVSLSKYCEPCAQETKALSTAWDVGGGEGPQCCSIGVNAKTGYCCTKTKMMGFAACE